MLKGPAVVYTEPEKCTVSLHGEGLAAKDIAMYNEIIEARKEYFKTPAQLMSILGAAGFSLRRRSDGNKGYILEYGSGFTHVSVIEEMVMEENTMSILGWEIRQDGRERIYIKSICYNVGRGSEDFNPRKGWLCDVTSLSELLHELL